MDTIHDMHAPYTAEGYSSHPVTMTAPIILLGVSRSGKTSAGKLLAERLYYPFFDTDEIIRLRTGLTPRQLYRRDGLHALHDAEVAALRECCGFTDPSAAITESGGVPPIESRSTFAEDSAKARTEKQTSASAIAAGAVIAAGGGICDNRKAAPLIAAIPCRVFLYAAEATLFARLTQDARRTGQYPAFLQFLPAAQEAEAKRFFSELYARRTALYRTCCNLIIDTSGLECPAVAQKIHKALEVWGVSKNRCF